VRGRAEITCRELVELVTEYLEGVLTPAERTRFDEHVAACASCAAYLEQMRATRRVLGTPTESSISAEARATLLHAFRGWRAA
jgi:anti-sigma factor RsiW